MIAIDLEGVSKRFRLRTIEPATTLKTIVVDRVLGHRRERREPILQALRDIALTIRRGQTFGIIGRNGSGKSTLLKLMAGIYRPDAGRVRVHGRVAGLLELGAGFHPEFSGRENIFINGIVLGVSKDELRRRFDDIVRFAELETFIDEPVRTYSSGMYMRLGFSVAVHTDPDILLIDEILSVGDEAFQRKCAEKIEELQRKGKTLVLVSHDLQAVARWCDEVAYLDEGMIREQGDPQKVIESYRRAVTDGAPQPTVAATPDTGEAPGARSRRWGTREVEIVEVRLLDRTGQPRSVYAAGESLTVELSYLAHRPVPDAVFGVAILAEGGHWYFGTNTQIEKIQPPPIGRRGRVEVFFDELPLTEGSYYLDVAVHRESGEPYDYHTSLHPFTVRSEVRSVGLVRIRHRWLFWPESNEADKGARG